jgi:hypothetical protein
MTWPTWVLDEKDEKIKDLEKQILDLKGMLKNFTEACDNLLTHSNEDYEWQVEQLIKKGREFLK